MLLEAQSHRCMALWAFDFASESIEKLEEKYPEEKRPMEAYKCSHCKKWHIGHKSEIIELLEPQNSIA